jgi:hypothetical protein
MIIVLVSRTLSRIDKAIVSHDASKRRDRRRELDSDDDDDDEGSDNEDQAAYLGMTLV